MRAQVIDDPAPLLAVDHIRIESAPARGFKRADPANGLAAEGVDEGVVLDGEGMSRPTSGNMIRRHVPTRGTAACRTPRARFPP